MELPVERIREVFAESVGIDVHALFAHPMTLAELMLRSPRLSNSVDLMEAFARTAGVVRREHGVRLRLAAMPLDTPLERVFEMFMAAAAESSVAAAAMP